MCVFLCLCTGRGLATSWSLAQGVLPTVYDSEKKTKWNGAFHGGRPKPTGAVVPMRKKTWTQPVTVLLFIIIGGAVLSPLVSVQVPRLLLFPGTAATLAYCTNPDDRGDNFLEQLVEWKLAGETELLGENLPQRHFVHHKIPHDRPGLEPRTAAVGSQRLKLWRGLFFSPISSPLTTRRVTVEVFDPASTRV
jgi:hypothetical protein